MAFPLCIKLSFRHDCTLPRRFNAVRHFSPKINKPVLPEDLPVAQYAEARASDRRVYAWGVAETGALGNYTPTIRNQMQKKIASHYHHPKRLHFSHLYHVEHVTCGYGFTALAVKTSKNMKFSLFGTGLNTDSQIGYHAPRKDHPLGLLLNPAPIEIPFRNQSTRIIGLAAGRAHLLVLTDNEGVFSLGNNAYGQCGRPIIEDENYSGSRSINCIPNVDGVKIRSIECGQDHSLFIADDGAVFACGWGADGQTGQGNFETHWKPMRVTGDVVGEEIVKVSSAGDCVLALSSSGEVFGWGNSEYRQLSLDSQQIAVSTFLRACNKQGKIVDIAAGGSMCMVLNESGQVFVWGYGILGRGPNVEHSSELLEIPPVLFGKNEFQPDKKVTEIACGLYHMTAVTESGDLYTWGKNRGGCLGLGHDDDQFFPFKVALGAHALNVSCGVDHTVALCKPY